MNVLYVGLFDVFNMNAAGKRVFANALLIKELGHNVDLLGINPTREDCEASVFDEIEGLKCYFFPNSLFKKHRYSFIRFNSYFDGFLKMYSKCYDVIIYYGSPTLSLFICHLQKYAKTHNIKIFADVVDWLCIDTSNFFFNLIKRFDIFLEKAYLNKRTNGIIAISSYLAQYYSNSIKRIIVLPPLFWKEPNDIGQLSRITRIIYAGYPFRDGTRVKNRSSLKDRLDLVIDYLADAKKAGIVFEFIVYGFTKERFLKNLPEYKNVLDFLGDYIHFMGKVSMEIVHEELKRMDYSILFRDKNRMTMAGFPTKVAESISMGVPVITTDTTDITRYLKDGIDSIIVNTQIIDQAKKKVFDAIDKTIEERYEFRKRVIKNKSFFYLTYKEDLARFLDKCGD